MPLDPLVAFTIIGSIPKSKPKSKKPEIRKTSTVGVCKYSFNIETSSGEVRAFEEFAYNLEEAKRLANVRASLLNGKLVSKVKLETVYHWQRIM